MLEFPKKKMVEFIFECQYRREREVTTNTKQRKTDDVVDKDMAITRAVIILVSSVLLFAISQLFLLNVLIHLDGQSRR